MCIRDRLVCILILYKDPKFIRTMMVITLFVLISSNLYKGQATPDGKPDFSALLSYGNEAVMLEKLITETETEMQAVRDAAKEKDLQKLDSLINHLRSSWEVLRADQPLNVLYGLLRGDALPDCEALKMCIRDRS